MDAQDTVTTRITLTKKLFDAVIEHSGSRGMAKFFREAAAEKLARDFGVLVAPTLSREGQGKRTDLANADEATQEKMRAQAEHARKHRWKKE